MHNRMEHPGYDAITSAASDGKGMCCLQCLIRRGGVREKAFECPKDPFLLFPTGFHSDSSLCKPGAAQPYYNDLMWDPKNAVQIPVKGYAVVRVTPTCLLDACHDIFAVSRVLCIRSRFLCRCLSNKYFPQGACR